MKNLEDELNDAVESGELSDYEAKEIWNNRDQYKDLGGGEDE